MRQDHKFLNVHVVRGMSTAPQHVEHRYGELMREDAAYVAKERNVIEVCGGVRRRKRDGKCRVCTETVLVWGAVQRDEELIHSRLISGIRADQCGGNLLFHRCRGTKHTFAVVARGVTVSFFKGLVFSARGTAWHRGDPCGAVLQHNGCLQCGCAARIEDLASGDLFDNGSHNHVLSFFAFSMHTV